MFTHTGHWLSPAQVHTYNQHSDHAVRTVPRVAWWIPIPVYSTLVTVRLQPRPLVALSPCRPDEPDSALLFLFLFLMDELELELEHGLWLGLEKRCQAVCQVVRPEFDSAFALPR